MAILMMVLTACTTQVPSSHVWLTSEAGDKCAEQEAVVFTKANANANAFIIHPDDRRQTIDGFGGSLTESSAFVLACLSPEQRAAILQELFGEEGANFSVTRTQIGASDFSVEGRYSLCEQEGDTALASFSLDRDKEGFPKAKYPQIRDEHYDLYHLMLDVWRLKQSQQDKTFRIMANTWTAPAWMKENGKYYERENGFHRGGALLPEYYQTYADYIARYVEAWRAEGVDIWAVTPVNEPMGNDGGWESMDFSPAVETEFIAKYLGPTFRKRGLGDVAIYGFDQNIFEMEPYTEAIYGNAEARSYTTGMAVHWYGSTLDCFPEVLDRVHAANPDKTLFHSEGCIDNLGLDGWPGVGDYEGYKESGWFGNDRFWWDTTATDWAYSTRWAGETHPRYVPVHRYARYIINGINHWLTGFCDWNIVLDSIGGPNHVGNFCGAEVMVDYRNDRIYYTPYYYVLKQFSRSMRPGDTVLGVHSPFADNLSPIHLCASVNAEGQYAINILNTGDAVAVPVQIGEYVARVDMPANSVKTILVKL
jgi:glucosylceramidase